MAAKDTKSFGSELKAIWAKNKKEHDDARERKRLEREAEGTLVARTEAFLARWGKRAFYTAFAGMAIYLVIVVTTFAFPYLISMFLGVMGFGLEDVGQVIVTLLCGLFLVAWGFTISLFIARAVWRAYAKAMKGTAKKKPGQET